MSKSGQPLQTFSHDAVATPITSATHIELDDQLNGHTSEISFYNGTEEHLKLALGEVGTEENILDIYPGENTPRGLTLSQGCRLSVIATSATANTGRLIINLWR